MWYIYSKLSTWYIIPLTPGASINDIPDIVSRIPCINVKYTTIKLYYFYSYNTHTLINSKFINKQIIIYLY